MKKILLIFVVALFINTSISAQAAYTFSQKTESYVNLSGATVISDQYWDDFTVYTLQIPFSFSYFGKAFTTIYVMGGFAGFVYDGSGTFGEYELYSFDNEMKDANGNATISYTVSGSAPNRIMKIQTLNANFDNDETDADYANLQLWLYETSSIIEIHYGPSSIVNSKTFPFPGCSGPTVGLVKDENAYFMLSGSASNPTASATVPSICITGVPPADKVYRFTPAPNGINEFGNTIPVSVFPNPNKGVFTITSESSVYSNSKTIVSIKNSLGQEVYRENISLGSIGQTIHTNLQAGFYFIQIENEGTYSVKKIVVE